MKISIPKFKNLKEKLLTNENGFNLLVLVLFFVMTIVFTFPMIKTLSTNIADPGDPYLNAWILSRNHDTISSLDFKNYFNTNMFYPYEDTLLYSETLLTQGIFSYPIFLLTDDIVVTYNIMVLLSFALSAFTAYLLAKYYIKDRWLAILAGVIFGFAMFRFGHMGHLQTLSTYFIPLTILFFEKLIKNPTKKNGAIFGITYVLMAHASLYHMVFTTITLLLLAIWRLFITKEKITKQIIKVLAVAAAIIVVGLGPVYYKYYSFSKDYLIKRELVENSHYSADLFSIFFTPESNKLYGGVCSYIEKYIPGDGRLDCYEKIFFPGLTVIFLTFVAVFVIKKKKDYVTFGVTRDKEKLLFFFMSIAIYIIALGPYLRIMGSQSPIRMPYQIIYYLFPPAQGTRVPGRLDIIFYLALGILAVYGLKKLIGENAKKWKKIALVALFCGLVSVEYLNAPLNGIKVFNYKDDAYAYIKNSSDSKVVLQLPLWAPKQNNFLDNITAVFASSYHKKKIINGYSGFTPEGHQILGDYIFEKFPEENTLRVLNGLDVDTILIDKKSERYKDKSKYEKRKELSLAFENKDYLVYKLNLTKEENGKVEPEFTFVHAAVADELVVAKVNLRNSTNRVWISEESTPINDYLNIFVNDKKVEKMGIKRPLYVLPNTSYEKYFGTKIGTKLKPGDVVRVESLDKSYKEEIKL